MKTLKMGLLALPMLVPALSGAGVKFFDPSILDSVPKKLSETGIYTNINTKTIDTAMKHFEVNAALWSDAASKDRWIILPPGTHIPYDDTTDVFDYPEGTIFVKLFRHDTIPGNPASRIYWETRLLVKKTDTLTSQVWHGFSYKWNASATEATLVDLNEGLDTVVTLATYPHYRKWHFPSQMACYACHREKEGKRGVLGFLPPQLKRQMNGGNQITQLFNAGVFTGTQPTATLGRRWRGMSEPIPTGLTPDERFRVIDTMARAYIAANCSGCHGTRGMSDGAIGHAGELNYDFHTFTPRIEFGKPGNTSSLGLNMSDVEMGGHTGLPTGRVRMMQSLSEWNIPYGPGEGFFDMKRPWTAPGTEERVPGLISAGYPSYSTALFRQLARKSPKHDSITLRQRFVEEGDPQGWGAWIFKAPWGSKAWTDTLRAHNVTTLQVAKAAGLGGTDAFDSDSEMMPPLATYIPDTAALKILAEWAATYRTLVRVPPDNDSIYVTRLNGVVAKAPAAMPSIRNGILIAPEGWSGKAQMISMTGRVYALPSVGRGRYAIPVNAPSGVYAFRIGDRNFRASVLR